jgi:hypothetical protein
MTTCDTCKHWGPHVNQSKIANPIMGACKSPAIDHQDAMGVADNPSFAFVDCPAEPGKLVTGPKFGCVHWEGK